MMNSRLADRDLSPIGEMDDKRAEWLSIVDVSELLDCHVIESRVKRP